MQATNAAVPRGQEYGSTGVSRAHVSRIGAIAAGASLLLAVAVPGAAAMQGDRNPDAQRPFAVVPQQQGAVRRDDDRSTPQGAPASQAVSQSAPLRAAPTMPAQPGGAANAAPALPATPVGGVPVSCDTNPGNALGHLRVIAANTTGAALPAGSKLEWRLDRKSMAGPGGKPGATVTLGGTHELAEAMLPGRSREIGTVSVPTGHAVGNCRAHAYRAAPPAARR